MGGLGSKAAGLAMRRALALSFVSVALLAGCGGGDGAGLTFEDPKGTVDVERGMEFTLEFSVNASVGFDWEAVGVPRGVALVEPKGTDVHYENPDNAGDSGVKRFKYEAGDQAGRQTLVFRHLYRGDLKERRTITVVIR
jgi:predicted secreted protein